MIWNGKSSTRASTNLILEVASPADLIQPKKKRGGNKKLPTTE